MLPLKAIIVVSSRLMSRKAISPRKALVQIRRHGSRDHLVWSGARLNQTWLRSENTFAPLVLVIQKDEGQVGFSHEKSSSLPEKKIYLKCIESKKSTEAIVRFASRPEASEIIAR